MGTELCKLFLDFPPFTSKLKESPTHEQHSTVELKARGVVLDGIHESTIFLTFLGINRFEVFTFVFYLSTRCYS
jgi:hypothetical protein